MVNTCKIAVIEDLIEWVLVKFNEDGVVSRPIKLQSVVNEESGEDGVSANLNVGDLCLAPYEDGRLYPARIEAKNGDKEALLKERKQKLASSKCRPTKGKTAGKENTDTTAKRKASAATNHQDDNLKKKKKDTLSEKKEKKDAQEETIRQAQHGSLEKIYSPTQSAKPPQEPEIPALPETGYNPNVQEISAVSGDLPPHAQQFASSWEDLPVIQYETVQTVSSAISSAFSILNDRCPGCMERDDHITRITKEYSALQKAYDELRQAEKQSGSTSPFDEVKEHYLPERGLQIDMAEYKILEEGESIPDDYEQLDPLCRLVVPKVWLAATLSKCASKGPSFTIKKLMDGFYEPEDLLGKKASSLSSTELMKSLRMYAINKLRMKSSNFLTAVNQKIATCKRAVQMKRRERLITCIPLYKAPPEGILPAVTLYLW